MIKLRAVLRRRWPVLVAATLIGVLAGGVSAAMARTDTVKSYKARQVLVAGSSQSGALVEQDALRVTRGEVAVKAAQALGRPTEATGLASDVTATPDKNSRSIEVTVTSTDADEATQVVGAFSQAFLDVVNPELRSSDTMRLDQLQTQVDQSQSDLDAFDQQHPGIAQGQIAPGDPSAQLLAAGRQELVQTLQAAKDNVSQEKVRSAQNAPYTSLGQEQPAVVSGSLVAVPKSPTFRVGLLGLLGFLLGVGLVFLIERVSKRIDTRDELVAVVDIPVLAEIGYVKTSKRGHDDDGAIALEGVWAEPYRRVRSAIQFVQTVNQGAASSPNGNGTAGGHAAAPGPQVFLITSTSPGEGKSTTAALTGEALAEVGVPTVVIGGDFRKPEVDRLLGVPSSPSLEDFAQLAIDRPSIDDVVKPTRHENLYVAPAGRGTREVSRLVEVAKEVSEEARSRGATVIFDSSPLQAANDTIDLLPVVDHVILVVRSGRTTATALSEAVDTLRQMDANLLGVVLIGTPVIGRQQAYYYGYYNPSDPDQPGPTGSDPGWGGPAAEATSSDADAASTADSTTSAASPESVHVPAEAARWTTRSPGATPPPFPPAG